MSLDSDFALDDQNPRPTRGEYSQSVTDLVIKDLQIRRESGKEKYGTELMTHNGRDPAKDLYQELLDAVVYLRQELQEREDDRRIRSAVEMLNSVRGHGVVLSEGEYAGNIVIPVTSWDMIEAARQTLKGKQCHEDRSPAE